MATEPGDQTNTSVAARVPATRHFCGRRRRRWALVMVLSAALIFLINSPLLAGIGGAGGVWFFRLVFVISGLVFIVSFVSYLRIMWVERVLKRNPWVVWSGRVQPVTSNGFRITHVIELTHPQWQKVVHRTIPARSAALLLADQPLELVAAGDPSRAMMVSPLGGGRPMYARKPLLPGALGYWTKKAGF